MLVSDAKSYVHRLFCCFGVLGFVTLEGGRFVLDLLLNTPQIMIAIRYINSINTYFIAIE